MSKEKNLDALKEAKKQAGQEDNQNNSDEVDFSEVTLKNKPNLLDGYKIIEREDMPQEGVLYPQSWKFAYRCPTSVEVANFSTVHEQDKPGIINAIEDLIRKCFIIYDVDKDIQINAGQIIDGHRTFCLLLLRDYYLPGNPITYQGICETDRQPFDIFLTADKLKYSPLSEKLIEAYDGRIFILTYEDIEEPIIFLIPTIDITSKIFKYIIKSYKDTKNENNLTEAQKKENLIAYDKNFLLIAPYLFEKGTESIKDIINKYNRVKKDEILFKHYLEIASKFKVDNLDSIEAKCDRCGEESSQEIRFQGGFKNIFISTKDTAGYF